VAGGGGGSEFHSPRAPRRFDALLARRRYLTGGTLTEADLRLVMTLVRHDEVYTTHFKCCGRRIVDYPHLWAYTCDVVTTAGINHTINM
jgi:glutathionyl-hydroquinone reductase